MCVCVCVCVCVGGGGGGGGGGVGIRMASIGTAFPAVYGFTLKLSQYNGPISGVYFLSY